MTNEDDSLHGTLSKFSQLEGRTYSWHKNHMQMLTNT